MVTDGVGAKLTSHIGGAAIETEIVLLKYTPEVSRAFATTRCVPDARSRRLVACIQGGKVNRARKWIGAFAERGRSGVHLISTTILKGWKSLSPGLRGTSYPG